MTPYARATSNSNESFLPMYQPVLRRGVGFVAAFGRRTARSITHRAEGAYG